MEFPATTLLQAVFGGQLISIPSVAISGCFCLDVWCLLLILCSSATCVFLPSCMLSHPGPRDTSASEKPQYRKCSISISLDFKKKCEEMDWNSAKHSERDRAVSAVSVSTKYTQVWAPCPWKMARVSASWWSQLMASLSKMPLQDLYICAGCSAEGGQTSFGKPLQCCGETFENWFNTWDFYSDRPCFDSLTLDSISTSTK